jgi:carboxyl-terminal processing protease
MMGNKKLQVWLPLLFAIVMIAGMFFGYRLNKTGNSKGFFRARSASSLQQALDIIHLKYVDTVNLDSLETGAIQEMMNALDPHSVYFPPVEAKAANEELAGNFDGIGVEFNIFRDTVNIVYVFPGGPSEKAGLQIGDKIIKADSVSLTQPDISSEKIRSFIRGKKGSVTVLLVKRNGQILNLPVTRGSIPVFSVDASYKIDAQTGYIRLNKFTETSYEEVMKAMEDLQKTGLKNLVFDIRGNGGGYMNEAIDIADEFLDGDKLIVYTEGVNSKKREYRCKRPGLFESGKLVVLVDEFSASASEVLAGALQDWDRATIVGRRTFGKGLVQEQFPLNDGSALRLTVARYYTPLGRSIQRSYAKGKKVYMDEISERYSNGEALYADSNKINNGKEFHTASNRTLYGGGGIMPDIFVPIDTASYPSHVNRLLLNGGLNNFVYHYYLKHRQQIDKHQSADAFITAFEGNEELWSQFVSFAAEQQVDLKTLQPAEKEILNRRLLAYLARFRWRNTGYYQVLNEEDSVVSRARQEITQKK